MYKSIRFIMMAMIVMAFTAVTAFGQVQFSFPIHVQGAGAASDTGTVAVGVNESINTYAPDLDDSFGAYKEYLAPPAPPSGYDFFVGFFDIPNRTSIGDVSAGTGMRPYDFRGSVDIDTFYIRVTGNNVPNGDFTITWPANLNSVLQNARLLRRVGTNWNSAVPDMLTSSNYTQDNSGGNGTFNFLLIFAPKVVVVGPSFSLSPSSLGFSAGPGTTTSQTVTVTNSGTSQLTINPISAPGSFAVTPAAPVNIAAGGNQIFTVTFNAPSNDTTITGNVVFTHNASGSPSNLAVTGTVQSQGGTLTLGSDRIVFDNSVADTGYYKETIQLVNYHGQPLKGLTFDLISRGKVTMTPLTLAGEFASGKWTMTTSTERGHALADGTSIDTVHVVLLATDTVFHAGTVDVATFKFNTANVNSDTSTTIELRKIIGAAVDANGWPIDAKLNSTDSSDIQVITLANRIKWGDINNDDNVDILDMIMLTNHLAKKKLITDSAAFSRADIAPWTVGNASPSPDGKLDIKDLVMLQNIILTGKYPSGTSMMKAAPVVIAVNSLLKTTSNAVVTFYVTSKGITIRTESSEEVAGLQVDLTNVISTPTAITSPFSNSGFRLDNKVLRVVLIDQNAKTLSAGSHTIATIPMSIINLSEIGVSNLKVGNIDAQLMSSEVIVTNNQAPNDNLVPTNYALDQNYPNPFNPSTVIRFSLPQTSPVRITIYNMLGQQVRTLFAGVMEAGSQTLTFDGKDQSGRALSSGTYMYRMTAGTFVETKKMVLVK